MVNSELIKLLQTFPADTPVVRRGGDHGYLPLRAHSRLYQAEQVVSGHMYEADGLLQEGARFVMVIVLY